MSTVIDNPFIDGTALGSEPAHSLGKRISADRCLAVLLIGIELFVLANLSGARFFPLAMACAAAWGLITRVRLSVQSMVLKLVYPMLAIGFLLHYMAAPYPLPADSQFIYSSVAHTLARLLVTIQIMQLYLFHAEGRLPIWMAGCGAVALVFAADISVPEAAQYRLLGVMALFMAAFTMYGNWSRNRMEKPIGVPWVRTLLLFMALAGVLALGTAAAWGMRKHERSIESFLARHLGYGGQATRAGFTPSGQLQSVTQWKQDGGERVMLRIFADSAPGYLRGRAFDTYQGSSRDTSYTAWVATARRRSLSEVDTGRNLPHVRPDDRLYDLSPSQPANPRVLDVWPEEGTTARVFTPLGATRIGINGLDVRINAHDIVTCNDREVSVPYIIYGSRIEDSHAGFPSAASVERLTSLDGRIDEEVRDLASQIFADGDTTARKLEAVKRYFHENYTYRLGIHVPRRMDPITYFLTQRPPAHCEYFATGTAVLLRLAGVPCRYVVGYVSQEWNPVGAFWVARNKDAHAWVEAYDEAKGDWVIVESTPAVGVPQPRDASLASQVSDSVRHRLSILRVRIREYGLLGLLLSLGQMIWSIPGLVAVLGLFAALLAHYRPRYFSRRIRVRPPPHLRGMHAALALLERRTRDRGYTRTPDETLTHFATRLRASGGDPDWRSAAADCYALYVELRYQGQTGQAAVERFRQAVDVLPSGKDSSARTARIRRPGRTAS